LRVPIRTSLWPIDAVSLSAAGERNGGTEAEDQGDAVTTAREIMSKGAEFASPDDTVQDVARKLAQHDIGALPVCNADRRLEGMITDRDIAVKVVAEGLDPGSTAVRDICAPTEVVTIGADDSVEAALSTMKDHAVRRLPVIDGQEVIGMVSQADVATHLPEEKVGELVEAISAAP
jgi:CBS domain-containing protein